MHSRRAGTAAGEPTRRAADATRPVTAAPSASTNTGKSITKYAEDAPVLLKRASSTATPKTPTRRQRAVNTPAPTVLRRRPRKNHPARPKDRTEASLTKILKMKSEKKDTLFNSKTVLSHPTRSCHPPKKYARHSSLGLYKSQISHPVSSIRKVLRFFFQGIFVLNLTLG